MRDFFYSPEYSLFLYIITTQIKEFWSLYVLVSCQFYFFNIVSLLIMGDMRIRFYFISRSQFVNFGLIWSKIPFFREKKFEKNGQNRTKMVNFG